MINLKLVFSVLALIVVGFVGFIGYTVWEEEKRAQELAEENKRQERIAQDLAIAKAKALADRTKCTEADKFFVIAMDRENSVGQDIVLKTKKEGVVNECKYSVGEGDFEIKNSEPEYFKAVVANALITDLGTGPSGRSIRLYDVNDRSLVTEKKYFNELKISSSTLVYLGLAKQKADPKNCKDYKKITDDGMTPNLVVEKTIDLKTFLVKESKTSICVPSQ